MKFGITSSSVTATMPLPGAGNRNGNGVFANVGANGWYWAATTVSAGTNPQYASNLRVYTGNVNPANQNNRSNGLSVRCVAAFLDGRNPESEH